MVKIFGNQDPIVSNHTISRNCDYNGLMTTVEFKVICPGNLSSENMTKVLTEYCKTHFPKDKKEGIHKTLENLITNNRINNNVGNN